MTPIDLGKKFIVEESNGIKILDLIQNYNRQMKGMFITSQIQVSGCEIKLISSITGSGGKRYWFSCPRCKERVGIIYKNPIGNEIGCRKCLKLKYRKQQYKGMIEES